MGLVVILVQLLCFFFRSSLAQFAGIYRLLIVQGLTIVLAIGGLKIAGEGWLAIFLDANVLFMLQLYVHQFMTQLAKKEDDEKAIATAVNTP